MKKILFLMLAVCLLLSLAGCNVQPSAGGETTAPPEEMLIVAHDGASEYTIVNLLDKSDAVKEFAADLTVKTKATIPVAKDAKAGEPAIYVGTTAVMNEKFGFHRLGTYTGYRIFVSEGNIYVSLDHEMLAADVLAELKNQITKTADGRYGISKELNMEKNISQVDADIPVFRSDSAYLDNIHDSGLGFYQVSYTHLDFAQGPVELANYEKALVDAGYTLHSENMIDRNRFVNYVKGDTLIHINFFEALQELRIIYGPRGFLPEAAPVTDHAALVTPSVSIIGMTESVLCMVFQAADGSFFVIDGGWDSDKTTTLTLNKGTDEEYTYTYNRDIAADMESLYGFLAEHTPGGGKPQVTWMITHADPDHILLPTRFYKEYRDKFDLNTVVYNFPNMYNIGLGESGNSTNDPLVFTAYCNGFLKSVQENFPNANHYVYHTGDVLPFAGGEVEFLFTHEDYWPNSMPWANHTSGVWRFKAEGKTVMITGDAEKGICTKLARTFQYGLKSDILQCNHHGANGATLPFYKLIDPTVCFWACRQESFERDLRHRGIDPRFDFNAFLRNSDKVIGHYHNGWTTTVLLPSLEVQGSPG